MPAAPLDDALEAARLAAQGALGALRDGVDFYLQTAFGTDSIVGPSFVRIALTPEWLDLQIRRSRAISELDLDATRAKQQPAHVELSKSEVGRLKWHLELLSDSFRVVGETTHGSETQSSWVYYGELAKAAALINDSDSEDLPEDYGVYAGCLFLRNELTGDDPGYFIDIVCAALPEVEARQNAMDMTRVIEASGSTPATTAEPKPSPVRRRPQV